MDGLRADCKLRMLPLNMEQKAQSTLCWITIKLTKKQILMLMFVMDQT